MDTEKKAFLKIGLAALVLIIVACIFGAILHILKAEENESITKSQYAEAVGEIVQSTTTQSTYNCNPRWRQEGYSNLQDWWQALKEARNNCIGLTDSIVEKYDGYITEEQIQELRSLEDNMVNANCLNKIEKYRVLFDEIVTSVDTAMQNAIAEEEAKALAEQQAQAQQNYTTTTPGGGNGYGNGNGNGYGAVNGYCPNTGVLTPQSGINWFNGRKETYYNLNMSGVIANAQAMGIQGEYWVRSDGVKMYGDYVMVASQDPKGTIIETSLGTGIVLDYCVAGTVDIAVTWG